MYDISSYKTVYYKSIQILELIKTGNFLIVIIFFPITHYFIMTIETDITLNFKLKDILLNEVEIIGTIDEQVHLRSEMSTIDLSMSKVKNLPAFLGENDIMKTIQLLPGVQSGSEYENE